MEFKKYLCKYTVITELAASEDDHSKGMWLGNLKKKIKKANDMLRK